MFHKEHCTVPKSPTRSIGTVIFRDHYNMIMVMINPNHNPNPVALEFLDFGLLMVIMTTIMMAMTKTKFSVLNENGNKLDLWDCDGDDDGDGDPNIKNLVFSKKKATHLISGIGRAVIPVATPCRMGVTPGGRVALW